MNQTHFSWTRRTLGLRAAARIWVAGLALGALLGASSQADMYRPKLRPGGIDVRPVLVGPPILNGSNVTLNFEGMEAPYEVQMSPDFQTWTSNAATTTLKWPNYSGRVTVTKVPPGTNQFFRMNMLKNPFVGAGKCNGCHGEKVAEWSGT